MKETDFEATYFEEKTKEKKITTDLKLTINGNIILLNYKTAEIEKLKNNIGTMKKIVVEFLDFNRPERRHFLVEKLKHLNNDQIAILKRIFEFIKQLDKNPSNLSVWHNIHARFTEYGEICDQILAQKP